MLEEREERKERKGPLPFFNISLDKEPKKDFFCLRGRLSFGFSLTRSAQRIRLTNRKLSFEASEQLDEDT